MAAAHSMGSTEGRGGTSEWVDVNEDFLEDGRAIMEHVHATVDASFECAKADATLINEHTTVVASQDERWEMIARKAMRLEFKRKQWHNLGTHLRAIKKQGRTATGSE